MPIVQEFDDSPRGFSHRLRDTDTGETTNWTGYRGVAYLNGYVGHTAYYGAFEGTCTPDEFVQMMASAVKQTNALSPATPGAPATANLLL